MLVFLSQILLLRKLYQYAQNGMVPNIVLFVLSAVPAVVAFGVSTVIGLTFGLYPAIRVSKLDPILTLRTA